jgi:Xaa-Pro dipeptidase
MSGAAPVPSSDLPDAIRNLRPMTGGIKPISEDERRSRIEKARRLMTENRLDAILLEPGSSLFYLPESTGAGANAPSASSSRRAANSLTWFPVSKRCGRAN